MSDSNWLSVWCEYEGPSANPEGESFQTLVQTTDFEEARHLIRDNKEQIDDFIEHSVREPPTVEKEYNLQDVIEELYEHTGIKWAINRDGEVYAMKAGKVTKKSS